jgi:hypothetical protein
MKHLARLLAAIAGLAAPTAARALDTFYEGWHQFTLQAGKNNDFGFYFEVQPRRRWIEQSNAEHLIVRGALTYRASSEWSFMLGPAWTPALTPDYVNQIRLWEQALFRHPYASEHQVLEFRSRFEQRWIENAPSVAFRVDERLKWFHGIGAKVDEPGSWSIASHFEIYFNLNTVPGGFVDAGLDQTEFFVGPSWRVANEVRLETGYLNNYVHRISSESELINVWYFSLNLAF